MAPVLIGDEELTIGDEELTVEEVERLGARRLAEIVVKHCWRDEGLHQTVRIALAAGDYRETVVPVCQ